MAVGRMMNFITPFHLRAKREYLPRMLDDKVACMLKAKEYEFDYWDGDRRFGYGGYKYDGRWKAVARQFIETYGLKEDSKILDVGCGKAHILYDLSLFLPRAELHGFDISRHAIETAPDGIRDRLTIHRAQDPYPYKDRYFDFVFSIGCFHNLRLPQLEVAVKEVERVGRQKYILVESYRNEQELFNLQCWALTAESFLDTGEWLWLYERFGYTGDTEFIYME